MASLRQEQHYGLSCGKNNKTSCSGTLYHVKLTDTAIRALEAYQNLKVGFFLACVCVCFYMCVCVCVCVCVKRLIVKVVA